MEIQFVDPPFLPPERAEKLRRILDAVRVAPPSEKLTAFTRAARQTAREIICPTYPRREAVDRLWTTAEVHGLVEQFDENIIQSELAAAFEARDDDNEQFIGQSLLEEPSPPSSPIEQSIIPATFITPTAWPDEAPPPVDWLVPDRIPRGDVTTLHGDGGTGKTDIAIRLAANVARGAPGWLGHAIETGPVVFISAEEPERDLRRRVWTHAERDGYSLETLTGLHLWLPSDDNNTVLATADRNGVMRPTPLFASIKAAIEAIEPVLVTVDSVAATFAGSQVDRTMARTFVNLWRAVARGPSTPAVLLLDHPSLSGLKEGTGRSGNMDWRNAVRSALYLRPADDKAEADRGVKILETMKSNYGPPGSPVRLLWADGGLQLETAPTSLHRLAKDAECDQVFLRLLDERNAQGRPVYPGKGHSYAPAIFAEMPGADGFMPRAFAAAMERLFHDKKIAVRDIRVDGKSRQCIDRAGPKA